MKRCSALFTSCVLALLAAAQCRASVGVEEEEVVFRIGGLSAGKVFLVGDFNGWNPTMDLMVEAEGGFEIRLYLLPGTYRYRFIADGVSKSDSDNPCLDSNGNSCFILTARDGALEVILAESMDRRAGSAKSSLAPVIRIDAVQGDGAGSLHSEWGIKGTVDERVDADLAVGMDGDLREGESGAGRAFLLRGLASYRSERGMLRAFSHSSAAIDLGDPIGLIGTVGPYRYPASLFCRGVEAEGTLPFNLDGRFLYASRMRGYRSGLEGTADSSDLFSRRDFVDADFYGMRLGTKIKSTTVRYLFRESRRPKDGYWRLPPATGDLFTGYERNEFHGFSFSVPPRRGVVLDGELLFGRSFLSATGRLVGGADGFNDIEDVSIEREWERGHRLFVGISRVGARTRAGLLFSRTTLEGERAARGGRPDGSTETLGGNLAIGDSVFSIGLAGKLEQYSTMNTGSTFWLGRMNFWLDGDDLTYDRVPFLSSRHVCEVRLSCDWKREPPGNLPWGTGLLLEITRRWDGTDEGPRFGEIRFVNGMALHPRLTFLLDMRGVSYEYAGVGRDFVDAFLSLRASVGKGLWCAVGTGVNPYAFDPWLYAFSDHGRQAYLMDRGVFRALARSGEAASMEAVLDAEESLAEDWIMTFEAGFTF
ncbi:MAG: glycogen-binding domain-containing protein [Candidatus Krumholzibacteria bacterium]|nr:glycogen-binding domain-containing protein [Candidatus Krumholzibacteria bacterium]